MRSLPTMSIRWGLGIAVTLGLIACGYYLTWDWDKSLLGMHFFRQTQTAITAYCFIHEGFTFNYQTPVLGKPWAIPFELPLYQFLAALVTEISQIDLDRAGRLVSVVFWLGCLFPLVKILHWWVEDPILRWAVVLLIGSSPTYIYWSDSFMMESTALFFSLMYLYTLVQSTRQASTVFALLAMLCGLMAGLQKATTFLIALVPAVAFAGLVLYRRPGRPLDRVFWKNIVQIFIAVAVPMTAVALWTRHADAVKTLNPLGRNFVTSHALTAWNFGTMAQRESFSVWDRIGTIESIWGFGRGSSLLLLAAILVLPVAIVWSRYRMEILILIAAYLTGPLVFTNLFFIHEYYNYENSLYLNLAFGLAVIGLVEAFVPKAASVKPQKKKKKEGPPVLKVAISSAILLVVSGWGIWTYSDTFSSFIAKLPTSEQARQVLLPVAKAGNPQDVLLIYGLDWDPTVAYYSGRKAIMDREGRRLDDPAVAESLSNLSPGQGIAAMIVTGPLAQNAAFIHERVNRFHLSTTPIMIPWGQCYLKAP